MCLPVISFGFANIYGFVSFVFVSKKVIMVRIFIAFQPCAWPLSLVVIFGSSLVFSPRQFWMQNVVDCRTEPGFRLRFGLGQQDVWFITGAVCVYPARIPDAVAALNRRGVSSIPVAAVAIGFPSGQYPLPPAPRKTSKPWEKRAELT